MTDTTIRQVRLDASAWREGYVAGRQGVLSDANPYDVATSEAQAWQSGLHVGEIKRLQLVKVEPAC